LKTRPAKQQLKTVTVQATSEAEHLISHTSVTKINILSMEQSAKDQTVQRDGINLIATIDIDTVIYSEHRYLPTLCAVTTS